MKTEELLSFLIIGYDGYDDLWEDCITLFKSNWPDCKHKIYFINNIKEVSWPGIEVCHGGLNAEWSDKVRLGLSLCKTEFVCLLLEDFYIGDRVDDSKITRALNSIKNIDGKYLKLADLNTVYHCKRKTVPVDNLMEYVKNNDEYGISLQPSIWRTDFLASKLGTSSYNAWKFELDRINETNYKKSTFRDDVFFYRKNILNIKHGVIRGTLLPPTVRFFEKKGFPLRSNRPMMSKWAYAVLRFKSLLRDMLPLSVRGRIRNTLKKRGYKFMPTQSDKRD